jgi:hypothetical protein
VHNIKMDLGEVRWCCRDWIVLAQDRENWRALVNTVMTVRVPKILDSCSEEGLSCVKVVNWIL